MTEHDRAARRRLVWLLLTRGDLGAETLRSDGLPALRAPDYPGSARNASASSNRASGSSRRSPKSSRS